MRLAHLLECSDRPQRHVRVAIANAGDQHHQPVFRRTAGRSSRMGSATRSRPPTNSSPQTLDGPFLAAVLVEHLHNVVPRRRRPHPAHGRQPAIHSRQHTPVARRRQPSDRGAGSRARRARMLRRLGFGGSDSACLARKISAAPAARRPEHLQGTPCGVECRSDPAATGNAPQLGLQR